MNTYTRSMNLPARVSTVMAAILFALCADAQVSAASSETRAAIAAQSQAFIDGMERGDARAVAELFTADAKLIVSGVDNVIAGRGAIENFWRMALSSGVKGLRLSATDLDGEGAMLVETGTYQVLGEGGSDMGTGHYLFVWKKDGGIWRIHRDIGSAKPAKAAAGAAPTPAASTPATDRVGFPRDYRSALKLLSVGVQDQEPSVMSAFGNELAQSARSARKVPFPYGTVIAMEFAHGVRDGEGRLIYDAGGKVRKAQVARVDVMRRERGYGAVYGESRAGEWEFASYRPDGSLLLAPENAAACAACHRTAGLDRDFVFQQSPPVSDAAPAG